MRPIGTKQLVVRFLVEHGGFSLRKAFKLWRNEIVPNVGSRDDSKKIIAEIQHHWDEQDDC